MELIISSIKIIHVIVSVLLILVVLLQPGKSGDLGSVFGGGSSDSVFGSSGAVPFLSKVTRGLAVLFMLTSLSLGYLAAKGVNKSVVSDVAPSALEQEAQDPVFQEDFPEDISPPTGNEPALKDSTLPGEAEKAAQAPSESESAPADETSDSAPAEPAADTPPEAENKTE